MPTVNALKITVGAVDWTGNIWRGENVTLERPLNQRAKLSFTCHKSALPARKAEVIMYAEDLVTPMFGGIVLRRLVKGIEYGEVAAVAEIECVDFFVYADFCYTSLSYSATTTAAEEVINDIVTTHLAAYGITYTPTATGKTVGPFAWYNKRVSDALRELSDRTGLIFRVSPTKELIVELPGASAAPVAVTTAAPNLQELTWIDPSSLPPNKVTVVAGGNGTQLTTEFFDTDTDGVTSGGFTRFTTRYPAITEYWAQYPNSLILDGVPDKVIIWGALPGGPYEWTWDAANHQLVHDDSFGAVPANKIITLTYTIQFPFRVSVASGATPVVERVYENTTARTIEQATEWAQGKLDQQDQEPREVTIVSLTTGWDANQEVSVELSTRGITTADFITKSVVLDIDEEGLWTYRIQAVESTVYRGSYLDETRELLGGGDIIPSSGGGVGLPLNLNNSMLYNQNGAIGCATEALYDWELSGPNYGVEGLPAQVAMGVVDEDALSFAIFNRAAGLDKALTFWQLDDGDMFIEADMASGLSLTNYDGELGLGGQTVKIGGGGSYASPQRVEIGALVALNTFFPNVQRKTTSFTLDTAYSGGGVAEWVVLLDSATARVVTLPTTTDGTMALGPTDRFNRRVEFRNIGTATWDLTPATNTINGFSTFPVAAGQSVIVQSSVSTGAGWHVIASHGYGSITIPGADTYVIFNDGGVLGAEATLTFHKTHRQLAIDMYDSSGLRIRSSGNTESVMAFTPQAVNEYGEMAIGREYDATVDIARNVNPGYFWGHGGGNGGEGNIGFEMNTGETPGDPMTYATGRGVSMRGTGLMEVYQYGGLGTGAVPGMQLELYRNDSGNGAASVFIFTEKNGTKRHVWFEAGVMRHHTASPTEDNTTVSHTAGSPV